MVFTASVSQIGASRKNAKPQFVFMGLPVPVVISMYWHLHYLSMGAWSAQTLLGEALVIGSQTQVNITIPRT